MEQKVLKHLVLITKEKKDLTTLKKTWGTLYSKILQVFNSPSFILL